ncbi:MAG: hypothetical protein KDC12_05790, partial [Flavobacteriales bacterium]|nr:hypothetical protein [Flavobacteriales bacterium]
KEISDTASQVYLDEILTSSDQLLHSLTTVMELARQQTEPSNKQVSAFRVEDLIRDVTLSFEEIIREKELKLDSFVDSAIPDIICDRFLLEQALKILTGNAVKFTPPRGRVHIKAQLQSAHQIEISIADTGIGMNPDFLENIFEPFVQEQHGLNRPFQGLGLGLSLAKRYIEMLDAEISISSEKNVGTTAYIRLPINSN